MRWLVQAVDIEEEVEGEAMTLTPPARAIHRVRFVPTQEREALLTHECRRIKGLVLPPAARLWLWLAQQPDSFFAPAAQDTLPSPPAPSSASVTSAATSTTTSTTASAAPTAAKVGERMMQDGAASCGVGAELWPLLCFELQLKAEQEERLRRMGRGGDEGPGCVRARVFASLPAGCCRWVGGWSVWWLVTVRHIHTHKPNKQKKNKQGARGGAPGERRVGGGGSHAGM